jgi:hypothetical protein
MKRYKKVVLATVLLTSLAGGSVYADSSPLVTAPKVWYGNMSPDPKSRPAVEAFYNSIKVVDGKITGKMPQIPAGYTVYAKYSDYGNKKLTDLSTLKPGETFSLPTSTNATLYYSLVINGEGKNDVAIYVPSMDVAWGSKPIEKKLVPPTNPAATVTPKSPVQTKQPKVTYANMKPDPKSRPAVEAFYNSVKIVNGKVTGKMPQVPAGYEVYALYSDYAANKATDLSNYKPGQSFSLPASTEGVLYYELMVKGEGKNTVSIKIPSMDVKWGSKPPEKTPVPSAKPVAVATSSVFKDITDKHWAFQSIKWAVDNKIVSGYSDGTFKPNNEVTEAEFLTMLLNTYKVQLPGGHTWPEAQYMKAKELNYPVLGEEQKNSAIIREKVAELVTAVNGKDYSGKQAIQYLLMNDLANGKTAKSIYGFKGQDKLTRAEAVVFLQNAYNKGVKTAQKPQPSPALPTVSDTQIIGKTAPTPPPVVTPVPATQPKVVYGDMERDPKSRPAVEAFYNSVKIVNGKVTGKMPQVPAGYTVYAKYSDFDNNKATNLSNLKPGETFSLPVSTDATLFYELIVNGDGKNNVAIHIPSMNVAWGSPK